MKQFQRLPMFFALALAVTGFGLMGCDSDDDDDKGGSKGGGSGLGSKFFGGSNSAGASDDRNNNEGGEGGAGGAEGGAGGGAPAPSGGSVDNASCTQACSSLITCFASACGLDIGADDLQAAVAECTPECTAEATGEDISGISQLAANNCAGFTALAESEGICDDFDEGDFEDEPVVSPPPSGGNCNTACGAISRCCAETGECQVSVAECNSACGEFPPELLSCVSANANASCQAIATACSDAGGDEGEFDDGEFDEGDFEDGEF